MFFLLKHIQYLNSFHFQNLFQIFFTFRTFCFFQNTSVGSQNQVPNQIYQYCGCEQEKKKKGRGQIRGMGTERDRDEERAVTHGDRKSECTVSVLEVWCLWCQPSSAHMSSPSLPGNYHSVPLEPRWLLGETLSVWCCKEGSPMQFSLSSLLFSFVCDSSRQVRSNIMLHC